MFPSPLPHPYRRHGPAALGAVVLAPLPHGLAGAWDELLLMGVAFALFGGYVLWLRGVFGKRDDHQPPGDDPEDGNDGDRER